MDVGGWLRNLGLGRYESVFISNAIDTDVLPELTDRDLEKLGIPLGDRKRLIKAIRDTAADSVDSLKTSAVRRDAPSNHSPIAAVAAERRHLTVMICDLVGSTALSARLDPEDMSAVLEAYETACARITGDYDGFVADFRGDGILAYFGYPRAHEDDAERTVRAALDIIAAIAELKTPAEETLSVRIGIATGLVVVGELGSKSGAIVRENAVVGDAPNIAARLQALAEPGTIVVSASTRELLGDLFRLRDLGRHAIKGLGEPIAAWAVEGLSISQSRFEAIRAARLTGLVGRENEIDFLLKRQRLAWKGEGQIVLISGEPGVGKSRLTQALAERIADEPHTLLRYQCSHYHSSSALYPFIAQLERAAEFKSDDTSDQRLTKLEALLAKSTSQVQAIAPLFAALLSIPFNKRYPALSLTPNEQRRRTLGALLDHFESLARQQPVLLLFEDMQWADATSLELLDLIVARRRHLPVLALLTFRPEFEPPWVGLLGTLTLSRLSHKDAEDMVTKVAGGRPLPTEVMNQIVAKTDGNPLFIEELTKLVLETGILVENHDGYRLNGPLPPLAIPATLHDSLMARLDRLVPAKEIAQFAAAIGREFSYPLLRALVGRNESELKDGLARLEEAELVVRRGEPPDAVYSFKHALMRDAAYEGLLKSRRQLLHGQIARALEKGFADIVESQPEIVAHHYTEAGLTELAIDYWLKAGNLALSHSANAEAVKHLRNGIALMRAQPPSAERVRKELNYYLALGPAVAATEGDATPETLRVFSYARALLRGGGTLTDQMTVIWGTYLAHSMRAEHGAALGVARQCLALAAQHDHPGVSALAHRFMGQTLNFMGAFVDARFHLEQTLSLCAANQEKMAAYRRFGTDDQVMALSFLASTLLPLGYLEQSAAVAEQAVARARALGFAFTTTLAVSHVAFIGTLGWDPTRALAHADEAISLSVEYGLAEPEQRARFFQGALLAQSNPQKGIELMRSAIAAAESNGARNRRTLYLGHVASAQARLGDPKGGLASLDEAIQTAEMTDERFFEAELYRLRGEILCILGRSAEAEAALQQSLTIARQQQACWWELRAANSLAKHWHNEGRDIEAYSLLQPVYSWFTEGLDTQYPKDVKALLDELSDSSQVRKIQAGRK